MKRLVPRLLFVLFIASSVASGCSSTAGDPKPGPRTYPLPSSPAPGPPDAWQLPPARVTELIVHGDLKIVNRTGAGGGVTGASKLDVYSPEDDVTFSVKWKVVPWFLDSWNNSPRHELAAYEVQKLFLDPNDYVVPPTAMRCIRLDAFKEHFGDAGPTIEGTNCVIGMFALWLNNVRLEPQLYDEERFATDPNYAYHLSNFNVLTFLIDHKDGRSNNFLVSKNEADRRVFAIDNGIAFDAWIWNWFVPNWNSIKVPAVSHQAVDRLRQVRPDDIQRLETVAELRVDSDGIYRAVEPGPSLDPDAGVRTAPGVVQFGLTGHEIHEVREHLEELLEMVDSGELPAF